MRLRTITQYRNRSSLRHSTRMLGGARRPFPPDYLAVACRALEKVLKIDLRLRPYMQQQIQLEKDRAFHQQIDAALDRVYGPAKNEPDPGPR